MDYSKVSLVESVISQADNQMPLSHLILNSDFEVAYYLYADISMLSIEAWQ